VAARGNIAWARYGANGFQLARSLSRTHRVYDGAERTWCGIPIPRGADVDYGDAGTGRCRRCLTIEEARS
jgi:hypothetical protein